MPSEAMTGDSSRRQVLKGAGLLAALASCGLLAPGTVWAIAEETAFAATTMPLALAALGGIYAVGTQVLLTVPEVAENGAVVPVSVDCQLPNVKEIYIVIDSNPYPMAVRFSTPQGTDPFVSMRVKMAGSGTVYAVVRSGAELYATSKPIAVTAGGCG